MIKYKKIIGVSLGALMLSGCATKRVVNCDFTMPPKGIDISEMKNLKLITINAPRVKISGNFFTDKDKEVVSNFIKNKISADIMSENFYTVTDNLYLSENKRSENLLNKLLDNTGSKHGFGTGNELNSPLPVNENISTMAIQLELNSNISRNAESVKYTLVKTPYNVSKDKKGVPESKANSDAKTKNKVVSKVKYDTIKLAATVKVAIKNSENKVIYKKSIPVSSSIKIGGTDGAKTYPTKMELLASLLNVSIKSITKDISPYNEQRVLEVNETGNKKAVVLIQAQAYTTAIEVLETMLEATEGVLISADWENLALAYEASGDLEVASDYYNEAISADPANKAAQAGVDRLEEIKKANKKIKKNK